MERITRTCTLATIACALASGVAVADEPSWTEGAFVEARVAGSVEVIEPGDGVVYVAGRFESVAGIVTPNVAMFDGVEWYGMGTWATGPDGEVLTLCFADGALYAGGEFTVSDGTLASRVARWDGESWSPVGWLTGGDAVTALAMTDDGSGPTLYAAVRTDQPHDEAGSYVLRFGSSGQWEHVGGTPQDPLLFDGRIYDLEPMRDAPGCLYAAGRFGQVGDLTIRSLAAWDGSTWEAVGGDGLWYWHNDDGDDGLDLVKRPGEVYELQYAWHQGGEMALFVVGEFENAGAQPIEDIVAWQDGAWHPLPPLDVRGYVAATSWNGDLLVSPRYYASDDGPDLNLVMRLDDGKHWVAETVDRYRADSRAALCKTHLAGADRLFYGGTWRWDSSYTYYWGIQQWTHGRWFGLGGDALSLHRSAEIKAMAVYGDGAKQQLYLGGNLHRSDSFHPFHGIASWDGQSFSYVDNAHIFGVTDMLVHDEGTGPRLYVSASGPISTPGGFVAERVAAWDGSQWLHVGSNPGGGLWGVADLEVYDSGDGDRLYIGGDSVFRMLENGDWVLPGFGVDGYVRAMTVGELAGSSVLFVGGDINRAGFVFPENIAVWDGQEWHEVGAGLPDVVTSLAWYGGELYAATDSPQPLVVWDGSDWSELDRQPDAPVRRLRVIDDKLYVLGEFEQFGDLPLQGVAIFDGQTWSGVEGSPVGVGDVCFYDDGRGEPAFYVGGDFVEAGGVASWKIARYGRPLPPRLPADLNNDGAVDQSDLGLLLRSFGTEPGQPFFDVRTDLNRDFQINQPDLAELLGMHGRGR